MIRPPVSILGSLYSCIYITLATKINPGTMQGDELWLCFCVLSKCAAFSSVSCRVLLQRARVYLLGYKGLRMRFA